MKTVTFKITKAHIDAGVFRDCTDCPFALALRAAGCRAVHVGVNVHVKIDGAHHRAALSQDMRQWIYDFDRGFTVFPQTFTLEFLKS